MAMPKYSTVRNRAGQITGTTGLTDKQVEFVKHYLANGGDQNAAAKDAGYAFPAQSGYELMRLAHIQYAIKQTQTLNLHGRLASLAFKELESILTDPRNDKDFKALKLNASKTILDRAGYAPGAKDTDGASDRKALADMSAEELESFIRKSRQALDQADKPMIEGECTQGGESDEG